MALTPTEEAQTRELLSQQAAILSLADSEAIIISKLGATKVNLSQLAAASTLNDSDILLVRQGTSDLSIAGSVIKAAVAVPDATTTIKGKVALATNGEAQAGTDSAKAIVPSSLATVIKKVGVIGGFANLRASSTGLSASVTITADELIVENSGNSYQTLRSVSVAPSLAASGLNGLDAGTSAANTWYAMWVIWNGTTTAGLLSLSATSPTMPAGYTHKARVGWVRSDSSGNKYPLSFSQFGRRAQYKVATGSNLTALPFVASGVGGTYSLTAPTWASASVTNFVPVTASIICLSISRSSSGGAGGSSQVAPSNSYTGGGGSSPPPFDQNNVAGFNNAETIFNLESTNIYYATTGTGAAIQCVWWEDNL